MALIYAGIDEAGYGPLLGPLCVGMCVLRVEGWTEGEAAPDLWKRLRRVVARELKGRGERIAVADSKKLKLANTPSGDGSKGKHPLTHLERAALCFLSAGGRMPTTDQELFDALGLRLERHGWYAGESTRLPVAHQGPALRIDANLLKAALGKAGVSVSALRCFALCESAFNSVVRETGSKAETTLSAVSGHVRTLLSSIARVSTDHGDERLSVRIVCDRLGGRTRYQEALAGRLGGAEVEVLEESEAWSRYRIGGSGDVTLSFMPEAETKHMPVALASIIAKYTRELAMARFNRYWCARAPELKPTAGYTTDARRWLADAEGVVTREERRVMVRLA
jgi:hypothetical protein